MRRYELTEFEWRTIAPLLLNKRRPRDGSLSPKAREYPIVTQLVCSPREQHSEGDDELSPERRSSTEPGPVVLRRGVQ